MTTLEATIQTNPKNNLVSKLLQKSVSNKNGHYKKAKKAFRRGEYSTVVLACKALAQEGKRDPEIDAILLEHHKTEGRYAKALRIAKKYAKIEDEGTELNRKKAEEKIASHKNKIRNKSLTQTYFYEQRAEIQLLRERRDGKHSGSTSYIFAILDKIYDKEENEQNKVKKINTLGCFLQLYGKKNNANKKFAEARKIDPNHFCSQHNLLLSNFVFEHRQFRNIHSKQVYESVHQLITTYNKLDPTKPNPYRRMNTDIEKVCESAQEYIQEIKSKKNQQKIENCPTLQKNVELLEAFQNNIQHFIVDEERITTDKDYILTQIKRIDDLVESSKLETPTMLYNGINLYLK